MRRLLQPFIRQYRSLRRLRATLRATKGLHTINVLDTFPIFVAHGYGKYRARSALTIENINQFPSALGQFRTTTLCDTDSGHQRYRSAASLELSSKLAERFVFHGSDKATTHDYHLLYAYLLNKTEVRSIFEIGLGTNNTDVVSTMGRTGQPGASLRAFRDVFVSAHVFGADIDARILFSEERITTFWADQMNAATLWNLKIPQSLAFDIMIDDGLHAPVANLNSLAFFLPRLRVGGWAVIEDVNPIAQDIWHIVTELIRPQYQGEFIRTQSASAYIAQRLH